MVMMASSLMLFLPPTHVSNLYLLAWIAAIYLGYTLIEIPYGAWGAELSQDYVERNRITDSRQIFLLLGLLIAITVPIIASSMTGEGTVASSAASRKSMAALGLRFVWRNGPLRIVLLATVIGALAGSILADVCDLDMIKTGDQRTAFLFSFLAMMRKFLRLPVSASPCRSFLGRASIRAQNIIRVSRSSW